ncbi:SurA N-terminal domain-containing protein [Novosphingobium sp. G106]|uniref:peptidylprolyl isomerase n=1 Tax=Novosphingobium sp. G106 TaxID=2849500 RepID=UPI001C2DC30D|nr:peptidylprolyl isomerase [Novosphingobium sp. G106]MBV1687121.1 SurA N-terminal domain-containing protein [Novosphingobium sp. G106]
MLQLFRKFLSSKFGALFAILFLGVIAFGFAAGDIAGLNMTGIGGGDRVAKVGGQAIKGTELSQAASNALENLKQKNPRATMKDMLAAGGLEKVLDSMVDRLAVSVFGQDHGIVASDRLIDSEITKIVAFRGLDGKFSEAAYRQALAQRGLTDALVRTDLGQGLVARQILEPASYGSTVPRELAVHYAALLREKRSGAIALLPASLFAPKTPPTDQELSAYYAAHRNQFVRPERRTIRYATFGDEALKNLAAPSDAEIAAAYNSNKAQYAASETRRLTQLVVPTEAAARAVAAEVTKGKSLEAAASEKGLSATKLPATDKAGLSASASPAVADAAFAAAQGALTAPARSPIGWHLIHVDGIDKRPERTLDQVRGEIVTQLTAAKRRSALGDLTARLEDEFDKGGNLADAAKELGITIETTPAITSNGKGYEHPDAPLPPVIGRITSASFAMEKEGEPQVAEFEPNKTFVIFDVGEIAVSAPAPLAEIKQDVQAVYLNDKGAQAAKAAADKLLAETRKGVPLAQAVASLKLAIPPVQPVDMNREQLAASGQRPAPPLLLLFSMAKGTTKILPAPGNRGWFVVSLKDIVTPPVAANDPFIADAERELGQLAGNEYADGLRRAIRAEVKVERNDKAIKAVRDKLAGN